MFNDRPGFRNAFALAWHPWEAEQGKPFELIALPTVMMDSHFYDYQVMTPEERSKQIKRWINECFLVAGQVAVLWHPHTLTNDYGWRDGFEELVSLIAEEN